MSNGRKKLFDDLVKSHEAETELRKRNYLMPERDRALVYRYHHHLFRAGKKYKDTLIELTREFFISESRIVACLKKEDSYTLLQELVEDDPCIRTIRREYPQWLW